MPVMLTILTDVRGVCLSRGGTCRVRYVLCARSHAIQPLPNAFGLLLKYLHAQLTRPTYQLTQSLIFQTFGTSIFQ